MKRLVPAFAIACTVAFAFTVAPSQASSTAESHDKKHMLTTMPNGTGLRLTANSIAKEWVPSIVHLKGDVLVEIWTKNAHNVTVLRADEVDYNETTGELSPRGNVGLTVKEAK